MQRTPKDGNRAERKANSLRDFRESGSIALFASQLGHMSEESTLKWYVQAAMKHQTQTLTKGN